MLPSPVTFARRGTYRRYTATSPRSLYSFDFLLSRARVTNLGFLLLLFVAALSLLSNLYFLHSTRYQEHANPSALLSAITRDPSVRRLSHLIIVPGHAIWKGINPELRLHEDQWVLEPYQMGSGRVSAFFAHILRGGQTRATSTTTEAESYMRLAVAADVFLTKSPPFTRATTEDHALDSYQNLLFSIARFHEYTTRYPAKITVVGYEFKRTRFTDLHRRALRWPIEKFHYIGVDPQTHHRLTVEEGERKNGYVPYSQDLYGCHSVLLSKRRQRNRHARFHSYYQSSPELRDLIDWCPNLASSSKDEGEQLFPGELPWDN
ncbi:hypothetical protein C0989_004690 [Termitomyces sp. Mn162]|nr:hypothetical protein C0989_004690 [Termitomyces sp. Mn162]